MNTEADPPDEKLSSRVRAALTGERLVLVCRGWPGLGRVMQSYCLSEVVRNIRPAADIRFYSSGPGYAWLRQQGEVVHELPTLPRVSSTLSYLLDAPTARFLETLRDEPPAAVVVDGEPIMLPALRAFYDGVVAAMVNPTELAGRSVTSADIFLAFLDAADVVLCSSLEARGVRGRRRDMGPPIYEFPALVRKEFLAASMASAPAGRAGRRPKRAPLVAVVLGGGSMNDPRMEQATDRMALQILQTVKAQPDRNFAVFSSDAAVRERLRGSPANLELRAASECSEAICEASVVVARAGRNTIAEILTVGAPAILLPIGAPTLRGQEQRRNTDTASRFASGCLTLEMDALHRLPDLIDLQFNGDRGESSRWVPGNGPVEALLRGAPQPAGDVLGLGG